MRAVDDVFDEGHKETLEARDKRVSKAFTVAKKMFEILCESDLSAEGRHAALQFLSVLQNRFGEK